MIVLDTPEDLDAWISERKRRWPSAARVEEKSKRLDEAVSRGQIVSGDPDFHRRKRPRMDEPRRILKQANPKGCGVQQHDIARVEPPRAYAHPLPAKPLTASNGLNSSDSDNDDIPPEVISSKPSHYPSERLTEAVNQNVRLSHSAQQKKRMNQQLNPPTPLSNPFGSQSPLLRIVSLVLQGSYVPQLSPAPRSCYFLKFGLLYPTSLKLCASLWKITFLMMPSWMLAKQ